MKKENLEARIRKWAKEGEDSDVLRETIRDDVCLRQRFLS